MDFYVTQINCLTGAIIARHILRRLYLNKRLYDPPQEPPPPPDCLFMNMQAGLKKRPASWEGGREKRPLQETHRIAGSATGPLGEALIRWGRPLVLGGCHVSAEKMLCWREGGGTIGTPLQVGRDLHTALPLCCMLKRRWWHHRHTAAGGEGLAPCAATLLHVDPALAAPALGCSGAGCSGDGCSGAGSSGAGCSGAGCSGDGCSGAGSSGAGCSGAGCSGAGCSGAGCSGAGCSGAGYSSDGCSGAGCSGGVGWRKGLRHRFVPLYQPDHHEETPGRPWSTMWAISPMVEQVSTLVWRMMGRGGYLCTPLGSFTRCGSVESVKAETDDDIFFALNFSLCSDSVIFAAKRNKRKSSLFFRFFHFFSFFSLFFRFFRLIFVSLRFFRLIFAYFTFVFASDFWCFASKWIMWNQAFFSLPSETKFSLQFQISLPKRKWGRTLV